MTIGRHLAKDTMRQKPAFGTGMDAAGQRHRLFFAAFPDDSVRRAIAQVAEELRSKRMVRGRWIDPRRYHMTLHFLGDHAELPQELVDRAKAAAMNVKVPTFVLRFDRMASFHGRKPPGVLRCADGTTPAHALRQALERELLHTGLNLSLEQDFAPHVTLLHCDGTMMEPVAIEPIAWTVREFVLVHSVVGRMDYRILARWTLSG